MASSCESVVVPSTGGMVGAVDLTVHAMENPRALGTRVGGWELRVSRVGDGSSGEGSAVAPYTLRWRVESGEHRKENP